MSKPANEQNFVYILSTADRFEYVLEVEDTLKKLADKTDTDEGSICKLLKKKQTCKLRSLKQRVKVNKVQIYDYVYVAFERSLQQPYLVTRTIHEMAQAFNIGFQQVSIKVNNKRQVQSKYYIRQIDLWECPASLAEILENKLAETTALKG